MVKALNLIEKINNLLAGSEIEEKQLYFHRNLHKANSSTHFNPAKADVKQFGKDSIVSHDVNPEGIKKFTHAVTASKVNPGAFEHHTFEYADDGAIAKHTVKSFASKDDALAHLNKNSKALKSMAKEASKEHISSAVKTVKTLNGEGTAKSIAKDIRKMAIGM